MQGRNKFGPLAVSLALRRWDFTAFHQSLEFSQVFFQQEFRVLAKYGRDRFPECSPWNGIGHRGRDDRSSPARVRMELHATGEMEQDARCRAPSDELVLLLIVDFSRPADLRAEGADRLPFGPPIINHAYRREMRHK